MNSSKTPAYSHLDPAALTVLRQLRTSHNTVDGLAGLLALTPNAVRNQLKKLEQLGFVRREGKRQSASKPSVLYAITLDGQVQFSRLYLPVLTQFLIIAEKRCRGDKLSRMMGETGAMLASRYDKPEGSLQHRVESAAKLLRSFGGLAEVKRTNGSFQIRSASCPLSAITTDQPEACQVLKSFLSEHLSAKVDICCETGSTPRCCFQIKAG